MINSFFKIHPKIIHSWQVRKTRNLLTKKKVVRTNYFELIKKKMNQHLKKIVANFT